MTRSSGRASAGRLPSGRAGASSRVISTPGAAERHEGRGEAPGVPGAPRGRDGAVPAAACSVSRSTCALQLGQLVAPAGR